MTTTVTFSLEGQAAPSVSMLTYSSSPISAHIATSFNSPEPLMNIHSLQFEDGFYQVTWPWKEERPMLPSNYDLAMGRLQSLVNRLMKNPEHLRKYDAVLQDQLEKGIIEVVPEQHPDFLDRMSSSKKLLETWRKGQKHLKTFWKLWFNEYVLSLCERTQKTLKAPRIQSAVHRQSAMFVLHRIKNRPT